MNIIVIIIIILASICIYVALYHFWMFIRRKTETENLTFSLTCLSIAFYNFACAGLYSVDSVTAGMFWQKVQFASVNLIGISVVWFIYHLTNQKSKVPYLVSSAILGTFVPIGLIISGPLTLSMDHQAIKHITIGSFLNITYYEADPGLIYLFQYITILIIFIWILSVLIRYYRNVNKNIRPILISFIIFFVSVLNDILVGSAVYSFIYLSEYTYIVIVISMAYVLLNKFIDLHDAVESLNTNLEEKVELRTQELQASYDLLTETQNELWGEMELAKKIQTELLPTEPALHGFELTAYTSPASDVGGDYFDIINMDDRNWIIIGDVSGHGISAGLIMMMVQTSIRVALDQNPGMKPSSLLELINKTICHNMKQLGENKYMTITAFAEFDHGKFCFSGLHQNIMIYRASKKDVDIVATRGMWIGITDNIKGMLVDDRFELNCNDIMILFTDGITEAWFKDTKNHNARNDHMFGEERIERILKDFGNHSPDDIKNEILVQLQKYEHADDVTMLIIKRIE